MLWATRKFPKLGNFRTRIIVYTSEPVTCKQFILLFTPTKRPLSSLQIVLYDQLNTREISNWQLFSYEF